MTVAGRGGRPKTPTNVAVLHGYRKDRVNDRAPKPSGEVKPPAWLDATARRVWRRLAPDLERRGVLTAWDVEAFACLCDAVARRARMVKAVRDEGEIVSAPVFNKNGEVTGHRQTKNPALLVLNEADAQVRAYAARFGLTPSDRASLHVGVVESDPDDDLLTGEG